LAADLLTGLLALLFVAALAATIGPAFLPYRTYAVMSGSMAPRIPVGALVVDLPVKADQLRPGDVVSFQRPDNGSQVVTHRIVQIGPGPGGTVYKTRGDANGSPDDWTVTANPRNWRVAFSVPLVGYLLVYVKTPLGQLLTVLLPALALGTMALQDLWLRPLRQGSASEAA
jgi:signal peptidase